MTATPQERAAEVRAAEAAFALSMEKRDLAGFAGFLDEEAVFCGSEKTHRGKPAVVAAWRGYFTGPAAPFSWRPETVEVLTSGELALSSGPVFAGEGHRIGTFNSIWRRGADGRWRVVFDKGCSCGS